TILQFQQQIVRRDEKISELQEGLRRESKVSASLVERNGWRRLVVAWVGLASIVGSGAITISSSWKEIGLPEWTELVLKLCGLAVVSISGLAGVIAGLYRGSRLAK
ncbi:MAG: hypothetical protein AAF745_17335, partial [Planctomycetota bacterium]